MRWDDGYPYGERRGVSQAQIGPPKDLGSFREALHRQFESLSPHLKRIAEYALGEPNRVALQTVAQVARETGVQPSTLIRFAKRFGFSGYSELQQLYRLRLIEAESSFRDRARELQRGIALGNEQHVADTLDTLADASILAIRHLRAHIDAERVGEAVRIMDAAESIYVIGRGQAVPVAMCLACGLIELQRRCVVLDGISGTIGRQTAVIDPGDLLIVASFGDDATALVDAVADAHERAVPVLAIVDRVASPLAFRSRVCFAVPNLDLHRFRPLAPHVVLAQSLILALENRKARKNRVSSDSRDPAAN